MIRLYPVLIAVFAVLSAAAQNGDIASLHKRIPLAHFASNELPESQISIKARTQSKIQITWPAAAGEISHYVIERSVNGRSYYEAGIVFTGEEMETADCFFTDDLRMNYGGPLYYRLRIVAMDKTETVTPVTVIGRFGGVNPVTH